MKRYKEILTGTSLESDSRETKSKKDQKILNDLAYAELMVSCQKDVCFNIIDAAKSEKWPEGHTASLWKDWKIVLNQKHQAIWYYSRRNSTYVH
jgi:hypothetical protein